MYYLSNYAEGKVSSVSSSNENAASLPGLVAYWTFNGNVRDSVSGLLLFNQYQCGSYVSDRRGRARSALFFNNGYAQIPSAVFFVQNYTTMLWINWPGVQQPVFQSNVFIVQNNYAQDFVYLKLDAYGVMQIAQGTDQTYQSTFNVYQLAKTQWVHIAIAYVSFFIHQKIIIQQNMIIKQTIYSFAKLYHNY